MAKKKGKKLSAGQKAVLQPVDKAVGSPADKIKARRVHKDLTLKASIMSSKQPAPFRVWYQETWPKVKSGK